MFTDWKLFLDAVTLCVVTFHLELLIAAPWWPNDATAKLFKNDLKHIIFHIFGIICKAVYNNVLVTLMSVISLNHYIGLRF